MTDLGHFLVGPLVVCLGFGFGFGSSGEFSDEVDTDTDFTDVDADFVASCSRAMLFEPSRSVAKGMKK